MLPSAGRQRGPGGRTHERDKRNPRQTAGISAKSKNYSSMSITTLFPRCFHTAERKNPRLTAGVSQRGNYSSISMTTPEPTVRPLPRKLRFRGYPLNLNAQGGKAALPPRFCPSDKTLVRALRRAPSAMGPRGRPHDTLAKRNPRL